MSAVLVGYDATDTSTTAVREAAELARKLDRPLEIVIAVDEKHVGKGPLNAWSGDELHKSLNDRHRRMVELAQQQASAMAAELGDLDVETVAAIGSPADVLVERAEHVAASMIVVGNRNTQGARRLLGSVASEVVHRAPCAVHIAKTT